MSVSLVGTIVRLQVQRSSLKLGERPQRWFDPAPLTEVTSLELEPAGAVGITAEGERILDIHNQRHPDTRFAKDNGLSVGFTSHYALMRQRFGDVVVDGLAGENIVVECDSAFRLADLPAALILETSAGHTHLTGARPIEPCVEFSRYLLGFRGAPGHDLVTPAQHDQASLTDFAPNAPNRPDPNVKDTLIFLRRGMRGYVATYTSGPTIIRTGDRLLLP